jgi:hypothetical protein
MKDNRKQADAQRQKKKPYRRPVLEQYGSVAKLARTIISGPLGDGGAHPTNMRL